VLTTQNGEIDKKEMQWTLLTTWKVETGTSQENHFDRMALEPHPESEPFVPIGRSEEGWCLEGRNCFRVSSGIPGASPHSIPRITHALTMHAVTEFIIF